ncbi:ATP-dependent zinc metalloprotease FtsH [Bacteroides sp. 51]|uniref:ATP-dependent zinc metalloprotease FtsH n=1 Tax=Bacteroides sp. 51 TaxID=2302938 RepID=UPI0013D1471B|nr:ATP-dependent zinc metalloprotease FtsH [Bacteroides sp. 51]NDV83607.1 ATP-dependent metallopeptidase FtsH/Yme1/Tma family protein [Bacteroides sp. 51]
MKKEEQNRQYKGNPYLGFLIGMLIIILLNSIIFPRLLQQQIVDTDYGTFISFVENGKVKQVRIDESRIYFSAQDDNEKDLTYQTGTINDPELVNRLLEADSPNEDGKIAFTQTIPRENSPILNFLLMWVLPGLIFYLFWRQINKSIQGRMGGGSNVMSFGQSGAKIYAESEIKTSFADVAGQEEAKEALSEIVDFLHNPKKYTEIGASLPKGALLVGPPGTGKTLIARAVAGEAKVPFFSISGSEFVQMFVGMGAAKVRDLFKQAGEKAPCIIFIDEIDAIGKKRDNAFGGGNDEREQTLNQLLTEMDGFDGRKGVVILAATNRPESLDKALLRPGRFDRRIQMELPDLEGRKAILDVHLKKVKHEDVNLDIVSRATAGTSGAELANIVNEAALRAVRMGKKEISTSDLEECVEVVIAGAQKKGKVISDKEKKIIAYHEIGHAIVAAKQTNSAPVHKITIIPRTSGALGYTMQVDSGEQNLMSKEELLCRIATLTGGRAAEEIICNTVTTGASNDIEQATKLARAMITRYGMSEEFDMMALETVNNAYLGGDSTLACSTETSAIIDREVLGMIKGGHEKASLIIRENLDKIHELTNYLLKKETITGDEFMEILNA